MIRARVKKVPVCCLVENCELPQEETFGSLISTNSYQRREWESAHQRQQTSPPSVVGLFFFKFFYQYFVVKLA